MSNLYCAVGAAACWLAAIVMLLTFPLAERVRVEIGGKIEPLKPSWLALLVSAAGMGLIGLLAGPVYSGFATSIALGVFMLFLVNPSQQHQR